MAEEHADAHFHHCVMSHLEGCLQFAKRQRYLQYEEAYALALDYGINGTESFFPVSQLEYEIRRDPRFTAYIRELQK